MQGLAGWVYRDRGPQRCHVGRIGSGVDQGRGVLGSWTSARGVSVTSRRAGQMNRA